MIINCLLSNGYDKFFCLFVLMQNTVNELKEDEKLNHNQIIIGHII